MLSLVKSGYCPGPDRDLSMNFLLAKQSHHLLGLPSSVANTLRKKFNMYNTQLEVVGYNKLGTVTIVYCHFTGLAMT